MSTFTGAFGHAAPVGAVWSHTTAFFTPPPCGLTTMSSATFSLPQTYWSIVTGSFFGVMAPVITTVPRMLAATAGRATPSHARIMQTLSTHVRNADMPMTIPSRATDGVGA